MDDEIVKEAIGELVQSLDLIVAYVEWDGLENELNDLAKNSSDEARETIVKFSKLIGFTKAE